MRVLVTVEHRFERSSDGSIRTDGGFAYSFWTRYLEVFDEVVVLARVREGGYVEGQRADGPNVRFVELPHYLGPLQFVMVAKRVRDSLRCALDAYDGAVIMRVASPIAGLLISLLRKVDRPYALEVVGDPYEVFAPGAVRHPLRPFFRWWFSRQLGRQCMGASAVSYVTANTLQRRYPARPNALTTSYSSIELPPEAIINEPRSVQRRSRGEIVTVGSLAQLYKGTDVLLDAMALCVGWGLDLRLTVVGDGKHRSELEARSKALSLHDRVRFLGSLPAGVAIREQLDRADLFVLPSRTEGLPRAMIEAMARGLPCVGSTVGGIPELLDPEEMVPAGDRVQLAYKIREVLRDGSRMAQLSARNLTVAKNYRDDVLRGRRNRLFEYLRDVTAARVRANR